MKQKMSTADVAGEVACLQQRIIGMRLANIYDVNSKTLLLKVARSGDDGEKVLVILESGVRFHATEYMREKNMLPASFCMKLRKHLRGKRLVDVSQLGVDRIVDFTFGVGEGEFHLLLELYAAGNVVLTDKDQKVLACMRTHKDSDRGWAVAPGLIYPTHLIRLHEPLTDSALAAAAAAADQKFTLKNLLGKQLPYGPMLAEHCILKAGLTPTRRPASAPLTPEEVAALATEVHALDRWIDACKDAPPKGYVILKKAPQGADASLKEASDKKDEKGSKGDTEEGGDASPTKGGKSSKPQCPEGMVYEDFDPLLLDQKAALPFLEFTSFDAALDEFFSKIESQKQAQQQAAAEAQARSRVDKVRNDLEERTKGLDRAATAAQACGSLIEAHAMQVDACIVAINSQLATGISWTELERLLEDERSKGAPIAQMIASMNLAESRATLLLEDFPESESDYDSDDVTQDDYEPTEHDSSAQPPQKPAKTVHKGRKRGANMKRVVVDLTLNAFNNAEAYYEERKAAVDKRARTEQAGGKAVKQAAQRTEAALAAASATARIQQLRKVHWFEKFLWFVTTEGYLVLAGRDAQQNEILVRKYLKKDDVYVHADEHGAASTVVKNHRPGLPVSPVSLQQAGASAVCRSRAWDAKVTTAAWWVYSHQVSKTAPTGEALPTGSFMIRGRKNYLPPSQMVMGFTVLFRLEDACVARHANDRVVAGERVALAESASGDVATGGSQGATNINACTGRADMEPLTPQGNTWDAQNPSKVLEGPEKEPERQSAESVANSNQNESDEADDVQLDEQHQDEEDGGSQAEENTDNEGDGEEDNAELAAFLEGTVGAQASLGLAGLTSTVNPVSARPQSTGDASAQDSSGNGEVRGANEARGVNSQSKKRHLSKKERAALKKGMTLEELRAQQEQQERVSQEDVPESSEQQNLPEPSDSRSPSGISTTTTQPPQQPQTPANQPKRGQKGKLKKKKGRYADQDEEDAALLATMLAAQGPQKGKAERRAERKAKKAERKQTGINALPFNQGLDAEAARETIQRAKQRIAPIATTNTDNSATATLIDTTYSNSNTQATKQKATNNRKGGAGTPVVTAAAEVADVEIDDEDDEGGAAAAAARMASELAEIQILTAQPLEDDELLYAVPMCAPYDALAKCKFRVKLVPGPLKKGKAAKQALEALNASPACTAREKALLKAVPDPELVQAMLGGVKLSIPLSHKGAQKGKKGGKK